MADRMMDRLGVDPLKAPLKQKRLGAGGYEAC